LKNASGAVDNCCSDGVLIDVVVVNGMQETEASWIPVSLAKQNVMSPVCVVQVDG
jgi:hypothetical protein